MRERVVEVVNELGLHARAAARLVHRANQFQSSVVLRANGRETEAKSILGVLLLGAGPGARLTIRCRGEDEHAAMEALCDLIRARFGEEA
ncbi:MAG: HPr family phosphocarrier protein [Acidobacteriota bacterium]|nr:HPr family phosphocarrier protein [Acidobacteriota bacterium]